MKVLFWDIDGTLIRSDKAGLIAFQQATEEIYGKPADFSLIPTAGMTDCYIATQIIEQLTHRTPTEETISELVRNYVERLAQQLPKRQGFLIDPVKEILQAMSERPGYIQLLLTGNVASGADTKLSHFQVANFFDFSASAFGDNCHDRNLVAANALQTVRSRYPSVTNEDIFVIGDTPNDIRCGKSIGAKTVAVATGIYSLEQLAAHDPWWGVERLPAPEEFMRYLDK